MFVAVCLKSVRFFSAGGAVEWDPACDWWAALGEPPEPLRGLLRQAPGKNRSFGFFPYPSRVGEGEAAVVFPGGQVARIRGDGTVAWVVQPFGGSLTLGRWLRQPMTPDGWLALPNVWIGPAGEVIPDPMLAWSLEGVAAGRQVLLAGRLFRPGPGGTWTVEALPQPGRLDLLYAGPEGILQVWTEEEEDEDYGRRVDELLQPAGWPGRPRPAWGPCKAHRFLSLPDGRWVGLTSVGEGWEVRVSWGDPDGPRGSFEISLEEKIPVQDIPDGPPTLFPIPGGWAIRLGDRFLIRGPEPGALVPIGLGHLQAVAGAVLAIGDARWIPIPETGAFAGDLATRARPGRVEWIHHAGGRSLVASRTPHRELQFFLFPDGAPLPADIEAADLAPDGELLIAAGGTLARATSVRDQEPIGACPPGRVEGLRALPDRTILILTRTDRVVLHRIGPDARPLGQILASGSLDQFSLARAEVKEMPGGIWVQPPGEHWILVPPGEGLIPITPITHKNL